LDTLVVCCPISFEDHIEAIVDDLFDDYDSVITSVTSKLDPYALEDLDALLLAREECFEKTCLSTELLIQAHNTFVSSRFCSYNKQGSGQSRSASSKPPQRFFSTPISFQ